MAGAGSNDRQASHVGMANEVAAVGHQIDHRCEIARPHHIEIKPSRELALTTRNDRGDDRRIGFGLINCGGEIGDPLLRQRIRFAIIHGDQGNSAVGNSFSGDEAHSEILPDVVQQRGLGGGHRFKQTTLTPIGDVRMKKLAQRYTSEAKLDPALDDREKIFASIPARIPITLIDFVLVSFAFVPLGLNPGLDTLVVGILALAVLVAYRRSRANKTAIPETGVFLVFRPEGVEVRKRSVLGRSIGEKLGQYPNSEVTEVAVNYSGSTIIALGNGANELLESNETTWGVSSWWNSQTRIALKQVGAGFKVESQREFRNR